MDPLPIVGAKVDAVEAHLHGVGDDEVGVGLGVGAGVGVGDGGAVAVLDHDGVADDGGCLQALF